MIIVKLSSSVFFGMPLSTDVVLSRAGRAEDRAVTRLSCPTLSLPEGKTMVKSSSLGGAENSLAGGALLLLLEGRDAVTCREPGSGLRLGILGLASRLGPVCAAVFARFLLALVLGISFDAPVPFGELFDGAPLAGVSGRNSRLEA
jgi:hypothetical protein